MGYKVSTNCCLIDTVFDAHPNCERLYAPLRAPARPAHTMQMTFYHF
jgi:hypothetical protein